VRDPRHGESGDAQGGYLSDVRYHPLAPEGREVLTVEYKINLLAPAQGHKMVARGEVLTAARRLIVCKAEVVAVSGRWR
jgi:acyl-coenzyme A thioesterase PaaI-like protein